MESNYCWAPVPPTRIGAQAQNRIQAEQVVAERYGTTLPSLNLQNN